MLFKQQIHKHKSKVFQVLKQLYGALNQYLSFGYGMPSFWTDHSDAKIAIL